MAVRFTREKKKKYLAMARVGTGPPAKPARPFALDKLARAARFFAAASCCLLSHRTVLHTPRCAG